MNFDKQIYAQVLSKLNIEYCVADGSRILECLHYPSYKINWLKQILKAW